MVELMFLILSCLTSSRVFRALKQLFGTNQQADKLTVKIKFSFGSYSNFS